MFARFVKLGLGGALALSAFELHQNDYEPSSLAVVRSTRTALATASIACDYRFRLIAQRGRCDAEEYKALKSRVHQIAAEKLLELCRKNRGVYVKVGQHIGALDYLLPAEYVRTMRVLHKDAPVNALDKVFKVIQEDLHKHPDEIFESFDDTPLGAASLAQVHKAKLIDGPTVAVKVQHHFVRRNVDTDIKIMVSLVHLMSWLFPDFEMQWLVDVTKKNIYHELDFEEEGQNSERLAEMFKNSEWLKIPRVFWNCTTKRVLTMEFVEGGQVNDYEYVIKNKIDPYDLSRKLGDLYSNMIFTHGFVHCDPHPGNILVKKTPTDKQTTVYLLDHGLYTTLTDKFRYDYAQFWLSIIRRDRKAMKVYATNLGIEGDLYGLLSCIVTGRPWEVVEKGIGSTKPGNEEKKMFQDELPNVISEISFCLEHMDRQALLILKTNDLIRSIEFALGTQEQMCGFIGMTKCCMQAAHNEALKNAKTFYNRTLVRITNIFSVINFYLFILVSSIKFRFSL